MSSHNTTPSDYKFGENSFIHKLPIIGVLGGLILMGLWTLSFREHADRALMSYLFAFASILSIMLGCMGFVLLQHLTRAGWSVALRRIPEAAMATAPLFLLLFIPIALNHGHIFSWTHVDPEDVILLQKAPYLNSSFFFVRSVVYLLAWSFLGILFLKKSVQQDGGKARSNSSFLAAISAPALLVYAITLSFASFDWLMSLHPHWYSTIFGIYFFAGCFLAGISFISLTCMAFQKMGVLQNSITKEHYHDLGKFLFGFTVFWAYIAFSQFMLIWYAGIPEEVEFFTFRLANGWECMTYLMPITHFFGPFFFLISRHVKKSKLAFALGCVWVMAMHVVDIFWLVLPNFGTHGGSHGEVPQMAVHWSDGFALFGMGLLFVGYFAYLISKSHAMPTGDPRLSESVKFENF